MRLCLRTGNLSDCRKLYFDEERDWTLTTESSIGCSPARTGHPRQRSFAFDSRFPYGDEEQIYRQDSTACWDVTASPA